VFTRMWNEGATVAQIAGRFGMGRASVDRQRRVLGLCGRLVKTRAKDIYEIRACLMCAEGFQSEGKQNRICPRCKDSVEWREGA
jgi:hypothetical protein